MSLARYSSLVLVLFAGFLAGPGTGLAAQESTPKRGTTLIPQNAVVVIEVDDLASLIAATTRFVEAEEALEELSSLLESDLSSFCTGGLLRPCQTLLERLVSATRQDPRVVQQSLVAVIPGSSGFEVVCLVRTSLDFTQLLEEVVSTNHDFLGMLDKERSAFGLPPLGKDLADLSPEDLLLKDEGAPAMAGLPGTLETLLPPVIQERLRNAVWTVSDGWLVVATSRTALNSVLSCEAGRSIEQDRSWRVLADQLRNDAPRGQIGLFVRPWLLQPLLPAEYSKLWAACRLSEITGIGGRMFFRTEDSDAVPRILVEMRANFSVPRTGIFEAFQQVKEHRPPDLHFRNLQYAQLISFDWAAIHAAVTQAYDELHGQGAFTASEAGYLEMMGIEPEQGLKSLTDSLGETIATAVDRDSGTGFQLVRCFEFKDPDTARAFGEALAAAGGPIDQAYPKEVTSHDGFNVWSRSETVFDRYFDRNRELAFEGMSRDQARSADEAIFQKDTWLYYSTLALQSQLEEPPPRGETISAFLAGFPTEPGHGDLFWIRGVKKSYWDRALQTISHRKELASRRGTVCLAEDGGFAFPGSDEILEFQPSELELAREELSLELQDRVAKLVIQLFGQQLLAASSDQAGIRLTLGLSR